MKRLIDQPSLGGGACRVEWHYDALGRRIRQTTWSWLVQSNLWVVTEDLKFVSDPLLFGRHVVDLNATNNAPVRTYVWGLDLSGTMDGAGGVGGLLWVTLHTASGPAAGTHFVAYDGNANIVALSAASDGSETARYEYGPFGEPIRLSGPAATLNPFRFSTKRTCNTTELVLYEYRAYNPALGRWLSRDPRFDNAFHSFSREGRSYRGMYRGLPNGGVGIHEFCSNDPLNDFDYLGLRCPRNTCNYWKLILITVGGVGAEVAGVFATGELQAHKSCCMDNYANRYQYVGVGLGVGIKFSISIDPRTEGNWFDTPCIPWEAHNGVGRLSAWGIGFPKTFGAVWAHTPQAYEYFAGTSWGLSLGIVTSVGYWGITPGLSAPHGVGCCM